MDEGLRPQGPPPHEEQLREAAAAALERRDLRGLTGFASVPSARYAHPTAEHLAPLFLTLGAAEPDAAMATPISGYFLGLSKRSIQVA